MADAHEMSIGILVALIWVWVAFFSVAVVWGVMTRDKAQRRILFYVAGLLAAVLLGGGWFLLTREPPPAPEATVKTTEKQEAPSPIAEGNVVLVIDKATLQQEEESQPPAIEGAETPKMSQEKRQEYRRLGRQLRNIEQFLAGQLRPLTAEIQRVDQRFKAREISNYDALYQKSQLKVRQAERIASAMEEKLSVLEGRTLLTAEDIGSDIERIKKRRDAARQKQEEYQGVLRELAANAEVFRDL